jgi:NAD(P)-dependent dehydrogenase (short-subunit alcohol dehydrogenase family)
MSDQRPLVLVTGATDGIGRETALELARRGARVLVHGRSADKVARTREDVAAAAGAPTPEPVRADLSSLAGVRALAEALLARDEVPSVLLHNAGVYVNEATTSADGHELTFAVNHLAPFLLTHSLLASPSVKRVVVVASIAHQRGRLDLDDLSWERRGYDHYGAYAASKLANVLFASELARRVGPRGVAVTSLHPGVVGTKLLTEGFKMQGRDSVAEGARTSVMLALDPAGADVRGGYFSAEKRVSPGGSGNDADLARRLYERSCELTGVAPIAAP